MLTDSSLIHSRSIAYSITQVIPNKVWWFKEYNWLALDKSRLFYKFCQLHDSTKATAFCPNHDRKQNEEGVELSAECCVKFLPDNGHGGHLVYCEMMQHTKGSDCASEAYMD